MIHRIGWWENLQEGPIFAGKNHGFRLRFSIWTRIVASNGWIVRFLPDPKDRQKISRWQGSPSLDSRDPTDIHWYLHCSEWYIFELFWYIYPFISIHIHSYPFISHIPYIYSLHPGTLLRVPGLPGLLPAIGRSFPLPDRGDSASLVPWARQGPRSRQTRLDRTMNDDDDDYYYYCHHDNKY